jgi:Fur family transcriptional regulator, iron response regulator
MSKYVDVVERGRNSLLRGDAQGLLQNTGLRSTSKRIALASLLLKTANRRVTAEILYDEAREARCRVSRATVCNTLRDFEQAGFLRRVTVRQSKRAWFVIAKADI